MRNIQRQIILRKIPYLTLFPGVEILWKGTAFDLERGCTFKDTHREKAP